MTEFGAKLVLGWALRQWPHPPCLAWRRGADWVPPPGAVLAMFGIYSPARLPMAA